VPELPEVEVVRRGLEAVLVGRTVAEVQVMHPRAVRRHVAGAADLENRLAGRTITAVRRRGKYLWLPLDGADALLAHLGMSGQLLMRPVTAPDETHLRARFRFRDGAGGAATMTTELRFVDQRTFGGLAFSADGAHLPQEIAHIARDPLDTQFEEGAFVAALRRRRTGLKRALLDQTLVSGVGNIYADEALWRARLHYARPTETMTRSQAQAVLGAARAVMIEALDQGGTSFDSLYVNVNGQSGYFSRELAVYGRENCPCYRCGGAISRAPFMNRSSYFCPVCQPRPRRWRA
jgi:formamidopyrimidine-DNA glycosylase